MGWRHSVLLTVLACLASALFTAIASAAPADLDRSFGDGGVLKPSPASRDGFEGANQMATGRGGIYLLRSVQACGSCGATLFLTRFGSNGTPDRSFGKGGSATVTGNLRNTYMHTALTIDGRGRPLVVTTKGSGIAVFRLTDSGRRDPSFGLNGETMLPCDCEAMYWSISADASGGATLAGWRTELAPGYPSPIAFQVGVAVFRLRSGGGLDASFGSGGTATTTFPESSAPNFLVPQPNGTTIGAGAGCCRPSLLRLVRIGAGGTRDDPFATSTSAAISNFDLFKEEEAGPLVIVPREGGSFDLLGTSGVTDGFELRFHADGSIDSGFGRGGLIRLPWPIHTAAADSRGRVVALGSDFGLEGTIVFRLRRNGRLDRTFGGGNPVRLPAGIGSWAQIAMQFGGRPVFFEPGFRACRQYCPPAPVLVRLRGGTSAARCFGKKATIVGTRSGETLVGTPHRDVIAALDGADTVRGRGGNDLICGGGGRDRIFGGAGRDHIRR
jgi:Ca2+-binding RTX toxin-like protein